MVKVKFKYFVLFLSAALLIVSVSLSMRVAWNLESHHINSATEQYELNVQNSFQSMVEANVELMSASIGFLLQDNDLVSALRNEDRNALLQRSATVFDTLKNNHEVTHLYFHNIDRINLLRVHKPDRFGDEIIRFTTVNASHEGYPSSGLELGPLGTFTLRLVTPVYDRGQIIGFIEMGKEVDNILQDIHEQLGVDLLMEIDKSFVEEKSWKEAMEVLGRPVEWDLLPNSVLVSQTLSETPVELLELAYSEEADREGGGNFVVLNEKQFSTSFSEIYDASGGRVGYLVVLQDITSLIAHAKEDFIQTTIIIIILMLLAFGVIYMVLNKTEWAMSDTEKKLEESLNGLVTTLSKVIDVRDPYTSGHQSNVAKLAVEIAKEMDLDEVQIKGVYLGATIHDIGKLQVPADILNKPGQLDKLEFRLIQRHSQVAFDILKDISFPFPVAEIAHQHHERMDGSGYPQGLMGEDIIIEARIVAVADVVESMSSHRPYRPSLGVEKALKEIKDKRGTCFDASVVDACLIVFTENKFNFQQGNKGFTLGEGSKS